MYHSHCDNLVDSVSLQLLDEYYLFLSPFSGYRQESIWIINTCGDTFNSLEKVVPPRTVLVPAATENKEIYAQQTSDVTVGYMSLRVHTISFFFLFCSYFIQASVLLK